MPNTRPLSPHLDIYRWRVNMLQSTLHRLTGLFLSLGTLLVTWGLIAAATSEAAWSTFANFSGSWFGVLLLVLWTWSLSFHFCNGMHHLFRDMGMNFGPPTRELTHSPSYWSTGWLVIAVSIVLTALVWITLVVRMSGGPL
jgi:succinate dehydrogenase / fumarate reductase cytochrome b subunit